MSQVEPQRSGRVRRPSLQVWLHVLGLAALSAGFESVFRDRGLNALDEGWPLYAAMRLHDGGVLYGDVFFVFPPGHLLSAWLAYGWSPPGVVLARDLISVFHVGLCVALYLLGRRLMPPSAALLGGALVAVAAPDSHASHYLFGFRYLVFSVLALWCFAERLRTGDHRWLVAAGALAGVALVFRWDPAATVTCGIGAGVLVAERSWKTRFADGLRYGLGMAVVALPVLGAFALDVGWATLWREIVVRPIAMTDLQSLPVPPLALPIVWDRWVIRDCFVTMQFRLWSLLFLVYGAVMLWRLVRWLVGGERFGSPLLLAVVIWGGLFFLRTFGRSDEAHLDSTVPAACLLVAHALGTRLAGPLARGGVQRLAAHAVLVATFSGWVYVTAADRYLDPKITGLRPVLSLNASTFIRPGHRWRHFDRIVNRIQHFTAPDDVVLDLTASSLFHVASGRSGPGFFDVFMPGTFLSAEEERAFVARLAQSPPALVIAPKYDFDDMESRALAKWAPEVERWIAEHYTVVETIGSFVLKRPRERALEPAVSAPSGPPAPSDTLRGGMSEG